MRQKTRPGQWINTRVVLDMTTGGILEREGFFYVGPLALAEGEPDAAAKAAAAAVATATKERDEALAAAAQLRKEMTDLKGKVLSDDDRKVFDELRANAAKTEEERRKKAGEFDQMREELVKKHGEEKSKLENDNKALLQRFKDTVVEAAFANASELFGGDTAKTVLDGVMGKAVLGGYVHVEDLEGGGFRLVVKNPAGQIILGKDGKPAEFKDAIPELINVLPNKDRILRGSGKVGSGSSGGGSGGGSGEFDLEATTKKAREGDKDAIEALRKYTAGLGGVVMGAGVKR